MKIIFFGDSHTKTSINPIYINNSFNYAIYAENYILTYYKLRNLLTNNNEKIETIFLPIDLHSFNFFVFNNWKFFDQNLWYWEKFVDLNIIASIRKNISFLDVIDWKIDSIFNFFGKGIHIINNVSKGIVIGENQTSEDDILNGFVYKYRDISNYNQISLVNKGKRKTKRHLEQEPRIEPHLFKYFLNCLDIAENYKLNVVLIKFPLTYEYFNASTQYINHSNFYDNINQNLSSYKNVYILDYQSNFFGKNSLFHDIDHLNVYGAEILSKKINDDLISLGLIGMDKTNSTIDYLHQDSEQY